MPGGMGGYWRAFMALLQLLICGPFSLIVFIWQFVTEVIFELFLLGFTDSQLNIFVGNEEHPTIGHRIRRSIATFNFGGLLRRRAQSMQPEVDAGAPMHRRVQLMQQETEHETQLRSRVQSTQYETDDTLDIDVTMSSRTRTIRSSPSPTYFTSPGSLEPVAGPSGGRDAPGPSISQGEIPELSTSYSGSSRGSSEGEGSGITLRNTPTLTPEGTSSLAQGDGPEETSYLLPSPSIRRIQASQRTQDGSTLVLPPFIAFDSDDSDE